jgi:lambda family phage tail tape measure protein
MATSVSTRNVSIRIAVIDGDKVRRELTLTGEAGQRALAKIREATIPASKSLLAINAVSQEVRIGMENLASSAGSVGGVLARLGPAGLAVAAVIGTVAIATAKGIAEFKHAEQALNALNAALKATDSQSGVTAREITALGEAIERNTLFKKTDIQQAAAALTTFQDVAGDTFLRTLQVSTDLAARLGTDVPSAAEMLGKALQNPEDGLGKLKNRFKDLLPAQKEAIEAFVKQGDIASAQAIILDHLAGKTKGLAEEQAKGLTGASNKLGDAWDDLLESFGRTVGESDAAQISLTALTKVVRGLQQAIDPSPQSRKSQLEQEISELENSFGTRVDRAVLGSAPVLDQKKRELKAINDALAEEQRKNDEEKRQALVVAEKAATDRHNQTLLEIEKEFQKKLRETTQTERDKILAEAEEAKQRVAGLFKNQDNAEGARRALESIDASTRAKLAKLDEEAAKPALQLAEANQKVAESLEKRLRLEGIGDPRSRFIQAEVDKLNASATEEYRRKVEELAGALYDREEAAKHAKEADEAHKKAVEEINRDLVRLKPSYDTAKAALDEWKDQTIENLGGATEANQKYIEAVEQIYALRLKDIYQKSLDDSRKWEDGVVRSLDKYADEATNAAKNAEELFGGAARKVEDTLVEMVSTGEFSFKKLGDLVMDIQQDILRMFIRENITGPIAGGLSDILKGGSGGGSSGGGFLGGFFDDIFGSLFHGGGMVGVSSVSRRAVPAHAFIGAPRLHGGLMPDEFPAILQRGETVLPKNSRMGGMNVTFNISTPNAQSFMDSRGQIMAKFAGEMQRFRTRNN